MKIEGRCAVPAPPQKLWQRLNDPAGLVNGLPNVEKFEAAGPGSYRATIRYRMGPVSGAFDATLELTDRTPPDSLRFALGLRGGPGLVNASGRIELAAQGAGTEVGYSCEVRLEGLLAAVGSDKLEGAAREAIEEFFRLVAASAK